MDKKRNILKMVYAAMLLALALVLPFLTGQIPEIGAMLCPMHLPVLFCGFICGWFWGLAIGVMSPILRSLTLGMPQLFPTALAMAIELAAYGAISGITYRLLPRKRIFILISLLIAMLAGRICWGVAMYLFLGGALGDFGLPAFVAGAFTNAIPGIILQILLIPATVMLFERRRGVITLNIREENKE